MQFPFPQAEPEPETVPAPRRNRRFWFLVVALLYAAVLVVFQAANWLGPDGWWLSALNLYLPQWGWALPGLVLLPLALWKARRLAWIPLGCLLWVVGPMMELHWRWGQPAADVAAGTRLRVMTYNVKMGRRDTAAIIQDLETYKPDLVILQEAGGGPMHGPIGQYLGTWNVQRYTQFAVASRLPIIRMEETTWPLDTSRPFMRCKLEVGKQIVNLYSVHLVSPRYGLVSVKAKKGEGADDLMGNVQFRVMQAKMLAADVRQAQGPVLLGGDLNAPMRSLVCRQLTDSGLHDAFVEGGRGYGYTYGHQLKLRHSYLRIDHLMLSKEFRVLDCWTGNGAGADHRPVFADIYLPDP